MVTFQILLSCPMYDLIGLENARGELICEECKTVIRTMEQPVWVRREKVNFGLSLIFCVWCTLLVCRK